MRLNCCRKMDMPMIPGMDNLFKSKETVFENKKMSYTIVVTHFLFLLKNLERVSSTYVCILSSVDVTMRNFPVPLNLSKYFSVSTFQLKLFVIRG
jgi:hypothetical protein